ncbi:hypothetical protein J7M23_00840 [Candidatus Sumerlaeota bacterium]|nr:hypothetical protein [Candidatus Sumerlaeota bacterium]
MSRFAVIIIATFLLITCVSVVVGGEDYARLGCILNENEYPGADNDELFWIYVFTEAERFYPQDKTFWFRWRYAPASVGADAVRVSVNMRSDLTNTLYWLKGWGDTPTTIGATWQIDSFDCPSMGGFPSGEMVTCIAIGVGDVEPDTQGVVYLDLDWIKVTDIGKNWDDPSAVDICPPLAPSDEPNRIGLTWSASHWGGCPGPQWLPARPTYASEGGVDYVVIGTHDWHDSGVCEDTSAWHIYFDPPLDSSGKSLYMRFRRDPATDVGFDYAIVVYDTDVWRGDPNDFNSGVRLKNWTDVPSDWTFAEYSLGSVGTVECLRILTSDRDFDYGHKDLYMDIDYVGYGDSGLDETGFESAVSGGTAQKFPWFNDYYEYTGTGTITRWLPCWTKRMPSWTPGYAPYLYEGMSLDANPIWAIYY